MLILALVFAAAYVVLFGVLLTSDKGRRSLMLGLRSLWLHKLRAFLSVLGIIIGTTAVITLMAFGEGSMQDALEDIKRLGATNIIIRSVKPPTDSSTQKNTMVAIYGLKYDDYERFQTIPSVTRLVPMRIFSQEIRNLDRKFNGRVVATRPEYTDVNQVSLAAGRFLTDKDDHDMDNVTVLGSTVADELFPFENPLGKTIRLGDKTRAGFYTVVGVLRERMTTGSAGGSSQSAENFNNDVYIPLQTCKVRFGERIITVTAGARTGEQVELSQVTMTVKDMDQVRPAGAVIRDLLSNPLLHEKSNDWAVTVPLDRLEEAERARDRFTRLLVIIGGISLVVGGIGIMNIMLATVTERTREIGIRRALGAKRRDIIVQFLVEAVVQTTVGGLIGVALGLAAVITVPVIWKFVANANLPAVVSEEPILIALVFAVGVGVVFGLYPAWRASRLDPIEALRHE